MRPEHLPDFDMKRHWAIIMERKYVALSVALGVLSIFTWGSFFWPKTYEASSTVFVDRSSLIDPLLRGVGVPGSMEERLRNLRNGITSRNIIERVVKKVQGDTKMANSAYYDAMIESIRKNVKLTTMGSRGDVFTLSYTGSDPKEVRDLVNTLVNEYIDENMSYRKTDVYGAYQFIESQLLEYKKRLEESDEAIRTFREENPNMVPQSDNVVYTRLEGFQTARIEAEIKLKELSRKRDSIQKQLSGEKELTVAFVTREGSPQARLNYLQNQLMLLTTKYTESYPEVIKVKSEIEELKRRIAQSKDTLGESAGAETSALNPIYQQLKEELGRTESEVESLRARLGELSRQQQEAQGILGRMPKEQEEWSRLQRDRTVYQKIYDDLLLKLESARVSKDLERTDKAESFRVVDPALLPLYPIKPNRIRMILLGMLFGIVSGVGAAYGLERLDNSFKDEATVELELKLPVLASIPRIITETDKLSIRGVDRKVLAATGAYLLIIGVVLVREILYRYMGISFIYY